MYSRKRAVGHRGQGQLFGVHVQGGRVDAEQCVGPEGDHRCRQAADGDPARGEALLLDPAVHGVVLLTLPLGREHAHQALGLFAVFVEMGFKLNLSHDFQSISYAMCSYQLSISINPDPFDVWHIFK